ncbi:MAG: arsenate reductase ArsC [Halioglobus sp.]
MTRQAQAMKVLYICTHNRCRSILAEAITRHVGDGVLIARSGGSNPAQAVHPLTLQYLESACIDTSGLVSESWDAHAAFRPDVVITVCDRAAGEACPAWFGEAMRLHWGLPDPSAGRMDDAARAQAFESVMHTLTGKIERLRELARTPADTWPAALRAESMQA